MNIEAFRNLDKKEVAILVATPVLITVLIAGADDNIDNDEKTWASKVIDYRTHVGDTDLHEYYNLVDLNFESHMEVAINEYMTIEKATRTMQISEELKELNPILAKVDKAYAEELVESWRSFARQIAKASGGFLGFGSISIQEEHLIGLEMLTLA